MKLLQQYDSGLKVQELGVQQGSGVYGRNFWGLRLKVLGFGVLGLGGLWVIWGPGPCPGCPDASCSRQITRLGYGLPKFQSILTP